MLEIIFVVVALLQRPVSTIQSELTAEHPGWPRANGIAPAAHSAYNEAAAGRASAASEPRERSAPRPQRSERRSASAAEGASRGAGVPGDSLKRRASERGGESEGRSPSDRI
jgi:hypothetical protein